MLALTVCAGCASVGSVGDLNTQKAEVERALRPLAVEMQRNEAGLDAALTADQSSTESFDTLIGKHRLAEAAVLERLAKGGNVEAMFRLADTLRESDDPRDVGRWFALTVAASRRGHPGSDDELVRWYWHQRGNGSIADVQRNRATALHLAAKAAGEGDFNAIVRVAVYISGDVHQYPGDLALARRVLELCAQSDVVWCEEKLVGAGGYDYSLTPVQTQLWLSRLALHEPQAFAERRDRQWAQLSPVEQQAAEAERANWRPAPWPKLRSAWRQLESDILARGAVSIGSPTSCTTSTPWCRDRWLR